MARLGAGQWSYALYRHEYVYDAPPSTPHDRLDHYPDTLREDELLLAFTPGVGRRPKTVWRDRTDRALEILRAPRAGTGGPTAEEVLLVHRRCLVGTGGCRDHPFLVSSQGTIRPLKPSYLAALSAALAPEWGTWKGVHIEPAGPAATAPVYLPGDANCCPALEATLSLRVEGGRLLADTVLVRPAPGHDLWLIDPREGRFGPVGRDTSEEQLRRDLGDSQVESRQLELTEGYCTPGARLFPGSSFEMDVAWSDDTRSRPAFARSSRGRSTSEPAPSDRVGAFHTPLGVQIGTTLSKLERLASEPIELNGFGWDHGGVSSWTVEGQTLALRLRYDPDRLRELEAAGDPARLAELFGDRTVTSRHPLAGLLDIRVAGLRYEWRRTTAERFCG